MAGSGKKKMSKGDTVFNVFICAFLALFVIVTVYPVINLTAYSLNERYDAVRAGIHLLPRKWSFGNYKEVLFKRMGIQRGLFITVLRTITGTVISLAASALLAFILSRKKFLFRSAFSLFWIITMYVQGGITPTYIIYGKLNLRGSFLVYIIPSMVNVLHVLVMRTYMKSIPDSLEEAAQLEGAGYGKIFVSIVSPLCKPVYAAVALFIATYHWNAWFDAYLYNKFSMNLTTLQYELFKMNQELRGVINDSIGAVSRSSTPYTVKAAAAVLAIVPLTVIYPFFQRYFVTGLTVGGVKE